MPKKTWEPVIDGRPHKVEVKWSIWSASGELSVDDKVIDVWGVSLTGGGTRHFTIAQKPAFLQSTATSYNLYIDGKKV